MNGKIFLFGILAISFIILIVLVMKTIKFAETAQENKFNCRCTLPDGEDLDLVLDIDTSDEYTPEILRQTVFNIEINNSSLPCECSK